MQAASCIGILAHKMKYKRVIHYGKTSSCVRKVVVKLPPNGCYPYNRWTRAQETMQHCSGNIKQQVTSVKLNGLYGCYEIGRWTIWNHSKCHNIQTPHVATQSSRCNDTHARSTLFSRQKLASEINVMTISECKVNTIGVSVAESHGVRYYCLNDVLTIHTMKLSTFSRTSTKASVIVRAKSIHNFHHWSLTSLPGSGSSIKPEPFNLGTETEANSFHTRRTK